MTCLRLLCAPLLLACSTVVLAQGSKGDKGYWHALSKTASSITGDVLIGDERLTISFASFAIAPIRHADAKEVSAVFDLPAETNPGGEIYRLNIPADHRFLHKNTLCGGENTTYMLTRVKGKTLQLAFFSGTALPPLDREMLGSSTALCGTFTYTR